MRHKNGFLKTIEMLRTLSADHQEKLLVEISDQDPQLALDLKKSLDSFLDLFQLNQNEFLLVFARFAIDQWALALRPKNQYPLADLELKLGSRKYTELMDLQIEQGLVPKKSVEEIQFKIIQEALELERQGLISILAQKV